MKWQTREDLLMVLVLTGILSVGALVGGVGTAAGAKAMHDCLPEGHICSPSALLNAPENVSATELALLAELDKTDSDVDKEAAIQMLNDIRLERKVVARIGLAKVKNQLKAVADEKWAQEKFMHQTRVDLENAQANRTRADTESSLAVEQLAKIRLEWSKVEKSKMEEALRNMRSMKTLAMAIKEEHVELQNALKELDVELPQADYGSGGGGKNGAKTVWELRERETAYFSQEDWKAEWAFNAARVRARLADLR